MVGEVGNGVGAAEGTNMDVAPIGAAGGLSTEAPVALAGNEGGCREANDAAAASFGRPSGVLLDKPLGEPAKS